MSTDEAERVDRRLEIVIAIGLGLAAVLTALCVYLTDVHDDEAQIAFNEGVRGVTEATGSYVAASQQRAADEALFVEYAQAANAGAQGDREAFETAAYLQSAVMNENLRAAVEWWGRETRRGSDLLTPFVPENPEYEEPALEEAEAQTAEANEQLARAQDEQKLGDTFIIADIIVASSLFLFGIAGVSKRLQMKQVLTVLGYVVFFASLAIVLTG